MELLIEYGKAFAVGGLLCVVGQLLIDVTKLTPARILTIFVVTGVLLGALDNLYHHGTPAACARSPVMLL